MKKLLTLFAVGVLGYFVTLGCTKPQPVPPPPLIGDTIISAYVDNVRKKFVLLGDKYHFVIENSGRFSPQLSGQSIDILFHLLSYPQTDSIYMVIPSSRPIMIERSLDNSFMLRFDIAIDVALASADLLLWARTQTVQGVAQNGKPLTLFRESGGVLKTDILLDGRQYESDSAINALVTKLNNSIPIMIEDNEHKNPKSKLVFVDENLTLDGYRLAPLSNLNYKRY